jgi:hypothetical protein
MTKSLCVVVGGEIGKPYRILGHDSMGYVLEIATAWKKEDADFISKSLNEKEDSNG